MLTFRPVTARGGTRALSHLLVVTIAILLLSSGVAGHAYLDEPTPGEGETLESPPEEIELAFTGDGIELADVTVRGPDGSVVSGEAAVGADDRSVVTVPLDVGDGEAESAEGIYIVDWEVLADDGHTTSGTYFFSVGEEPLDRDALLEVYDGDGDDDGSAGSAVETGAKGLVLLSVIGLVGIPVTMWVAVYPVLGRSGRGGSESQPAAETPSSAESRSAPETPSAAEAKPVASADEPRLSALLSGAALCLFAGVLTLGLVQSVSIGGDRFLESVGRFVMTSLGAVWLGQVLVGALLAAAMLAWQQRRLAGKHALPVAVAGGLAIQLTISWTSHSASVAGRLSGLAVDFAHIGGAALWLGGLCTLGVVVPALLRSRAGDETHEKRESDWQRSAIAAIVRRYSLLAMTGVLLAVVTGLVLAAWHVPDAASFRETLYGTVLSTKTLLVVLALGLGGFVRYVLLGRLESDGTSASPPAETAASGGTPIRQDGGAPNRPQTETSKADDSANSVPIRSFVRAVRLELAILIAVILLSGLLTSVPTAAMAGEETETATFDRQVEGIDLEVTVLPAIEAHDRAYVDEGEPMIVDVRLSSSDDGDPVSADEELSLFLTNEVHDVSTQVDLEETEPGTYSTVQTLPEPERWDVRIDGFVDGVYLSEWLEVYVIVDDPAHQHDDHDHDHGGGPLATLLRFAALAIGVTGGLAVAVSAMGFDRSQD